MTTELYKIIYNIIHGEKFVLIRRRKEDISPKMIKNFFASVDVASITNNKYNTITLHKDTLYLSNITNKNKIVRGEKIGYVACLESV